MKVLIVFGTRPEGIKMAPVVKQLKKEKNFIVKVCVTAQHREMLDQVLSLFEIVPDYDLNIMKKGQDLFEVSSNVLLKMKSVLEDFEPDIVFIHGDTTTSTFAGIASFYKQIMVAHVEAGLRTQNIYSPWPEEMNRQISGRLASIHFAPTQLAKENLIAENVDSNVIEVTGNTVIDALFWVQEKLAHSEQKQNAIDLLSINGYSNSDRKIILVTGHRRENFGEGFKQICLGLEEIANLHPEFDLVYPVHLNPNVRDTVFSHLNEISNIYLIEPLEYFPFTYLMSISYLVLTDSGGIQEEAPSLGKPVLVMRDTTERPEAVTAGTVKLVGTDRKKIVSEVNKLILDKNYYKEMSEAHNPYGDGKASERIVAKLNEMKNNNV